MPQVAQSGPSIKGREVQKKLEEERSARGAKARGAKERKRRETVKRTTEAKRRAEEERQARTAEKGWRRDCDLAKGQFSIKACTRLIQTGTINATNRAEIYVERGFTYAVLKQYNRAIQDYSEALRLNPKSTLAYSLRGGVYFRLKQYRRAIQDYNELVRHNPRDASVYGLRGLAYEALGQKQLALGDYRMVLRLRPGSGVAAAGLKRLGVGP